MEFRVLGPLEVVDAGVAIALGGRRRRALLALLLLHANEVVSADRLVDELWGSEPPQAPLNALQFHISQLRRTLPGEVLVTRASGYLLRVGPGELDLAQFESLFAESAAAVPEQAAALLRQALALWRGPALADLADELSAEAERARLEELRLGALEARIEADLALGKHAELVGELEALVLQSPLRERLWAQLMLALYRSGRQADALAAYRSARRRLVDEFGIEPGRELQKLEQAILTHDTSLDLARNDAERALLAVLPPSGPLDPLLTLAGTLARRPPRQLILAAPVPGTAMLASATATVNALRGRLLEQGESTRAAAFVSTAWGSDLARLAAEQDVDLIVADAPAAPLPAEIIELLERAPCDVALLVGAASVRQGPVLAPFGGADHDWAAVEIAAWLAAACQVGLRLAGATAGGEDSSRLLARAALVVQRAVGVETEPVLVAPGAAGLLAAASEAGMLVLGLSPRFRSEGLGETRLEIVRASAAPVVLVRRGLRPGGLAPGEARTRFTWSLSDSAGR